jgi:predicted kinase
VEAVIFIGLQASGKSSFFKDRFQDTHIRLNLDMLRTRNRERILLNACLEAKQPFVIDNTNPTIEDRARYIEPAKAAGFAVVGFYFPMNMEDCVLRNARRTGKKHVLELAIMSVAKKLERPSPIEGFDALYYGRSDGAGGFVVEECDREV